MKTLVLAAAMLSALSSAASADILYDASGQARSYFVSKEPSGEHRFEAKTKVIDAEGARVYRETVDCSARSPSVFRDGMPLTVEVTRSLHYRPDQEAREYTNLWWMVCRRQPNRYGGIFK